MSTNAFTRRRVLRGIAAGAVASGTTGAALANDGPPAEGHVIKFEPGASTAPARRAAETVRRELDFGHLGRAVAGEFGSDAIEELRDRSTVEYVEADRAGYRPLGQTVPWGIERIHADDLHASGETGNGVDISGGDTGNGVDISGGDTGNGVDISIIDTGIDGDHEDLVENVAGGTCFVPECCGEASCSTGDCRSPWDDDAGHGTHLAGIVGAVDDEEGVVGVAPGANLWAAKAFDACGTTTVSTVAAALAWTADRGFDVGLMAWGAESGDRTLRDACRYAADEGVLLVAAAGNDGPCSDCVAYPAAYDSVVAVSATTADDSLAAFSSTGQAVELAAPGTDVYSSVPGGYGTDGGTSMAAAHVAGAAGEVMAEGYSNTDTRRRLRATAEDVGLSGDEQGAGLVDVATALGVDS